MKTIIDAIKAINPNAVVNVNQPTLDSNVSEANIEWLENTTQISDDDIQIKLDELRAEETTKQENKETNKTSGKQKLKDLGLNDDEIEALIGV